MSYLSETIEPMFDESRVVALSHAGGEDDDEGPLLRSPAPTTQPVLLSLRKRSTYVKARMQFCSAQ